MKDPPDSSNPQENSEKPVSQMDRAELLSRLGLDAERWKNADLGVLRSLLNPDERWEEALANGVEHAEEYIQSMRERGLLTDENLERLKRGLPLLPMSVPPTS